MSWRIGLSIPLLVFIQASSQAEVKTTTSGAVSTGPLQSALAATNNLAMANIFSSCMNYQVPLEQLAKTIGKQPGALGGLQGVGVDSKCPPSGKVEKKEFSCKDVSNGKSFSPEKLKAEKARLENDLFGLECQFGKASAAQAEVNCLNQNAAMLISQIGTLQGYFSQMVKDANKKVGEYSSAIEDRKAIGNELNKLLNTGSNGRPSMIKAEENLRGIVGAGQLNGQVQGIKEAQRAQVTRKSKLESFIKRQKMVQAKACVASKRDNRYKCSRNGSVVTLLEYVSCRYGQNQLLGEGARGSKQIEDDSDTRDAAKGNSESLKSLLIQILGSGPQANEIATPRDIATFDQFIAQDIRFETPEELEKSELGSQLKGYDGKGLEITKFVMSELKRCYNSRSSIIDKERTRKDTAVGALQEAISKTDRDISQGVNSLLDQVKNVYYDASRSMIGSGAKPPNVDLCRKAKPEIQGNCLEEFKTQTEQLLNGGGRYSEMNILVRGTKTQTAVKCDGISQCVNKLQDMSKQAENETAKYEAEKQKVIQESNQNLDQMKDQLKASLGGQSKQLQDMLAKINDALGSLGAGKKLRFKNLKGEEFEADKEGLYKNPKSLMNLIGGNVEPPLPDVSGGVFEEGQEALGEKIKDLQDDISKLRASNSSLSALENSCKQDTVEEQVKAAQKDLDSFIEANCPLVAEDICRGVGSDSLSVLVQLADSLNGEGGLGGSEIASLSSGISDACSPVEKLNDLIEKKKILDNEERKEEDKDKKRILFDESRDLKKKIEAAEGSKAKCSRIYSGLTSKMRALDSLRKKFSEPGAQQAD